MAFAPKPEEEPKPEEAPQPEEALKQEEAPKLEEATKPEEAPKPEVIEHKPTAPLEAPQDHETVIEKVEDVHEKPEQVTTDVTTVQVTEVVKEGTKIV